MKFSINKADIVDVLSKVQGLTGRRSSLAITECVLLSAKDNSIQITATDLETGYEGNFPASVEQTGTIAINARKFYEILREFPSQEILIDQSENRWINIGHEKVQYHLMSMNPEDFPDTPALEVTEFFEVDGSVLKRMIEKSTIISGIGEDKKPHINGIWFERLIGQTPALIRMVSTDGSRLSKYDIICESGKKPPAGESVLIPKKGLHEVGKFLGGDEPAKIAIQGSYFILKSAMETFYIRLLEGKFPKYDEIIARPDGYKIVIEKDLLLSMVKRMSILCTESYRAAMFTFDRDELIIEATNPDIGESKENMAIEYKGDKIQAAFNPRFFTEAINGIDDATLELNIISEEKPCLIDGVEDKSYVSAIMPMRV